MTTEITEQTVIPAATWTVDPAHSSVQFEVTDVSDLMATIRGRFTDFEGTLVTGENFQDGRARGVIRADSINTDQEQRDQHLRSADFLDTDNYPEITFESDRIERTGGDTLHITGTLTMKEQPERVDLQARIRGLGESSQGGERIVLGSEGEIEFGPMKVNISVNVTAIREG